jgi:hypothetical protein
MCGGYHPPPRPPPPPPPPPSLTVPALVKMSLLPMYHAKLVGIRKDMASVSDKTARMKKRLVKLEGKKLKNDTKAAKEAEQARMLEESLRARPASDLVNADNEPRAQLE